MTQLAREEGQRPSVYSGVRWTSLAQGTIAVSQFVSGLVLFKLLSIEVFGIVAMAHVVTGFADQLRELGTRMALVQRREITAETLDSAFFVNLAVGSVVSAFGSHDVAERARVESRFFAPFARMPPRTRNESLGPSD